MHPRISVVINTHNEEESLPYVLRSVVSWADEIVVADMHSTDRTLEIARSFGARVVLVEPAGFVEPARASAVSQGTGEWILVLDADELVPEPLSRRLIEIAAGDQADVVWCPRRNFILGAPMADTGWGPRHEMHPRFFRRGTLRFHPEIHSRPTPIVGARAVEVQGGKEHPLFAIQHFNYRGFEDFLRRLDRYTSIEARQAFERGDPISPARALQSACREFAWRFVRARGYRDGWRGFYLSVLMAGYRLVACAKHTQLQKVGSDEAIGCSYARLADELLAAYPQTVGTPSPSRDGK